MATALQKSATEAVAAWLKPRQVTVRESNEGLLIGVAGVPREHAPMSSTP